MIDVARLLPAGLAIALRQAPTCHEKVALAWRLAVGPAIDQASSVQLEDGVLRVRVARAEWQQEIRRSSGLIRSRLAAVLGDDVVRSLKVHVDGADDSRVRSARTRPSTATRRAPRLPDA